MSDYFKDVYSTVMNNGIARIFKEFPKENTKYIDTALMKARGCDSSILEGINAFFIPNPEYPVFIFGEIIKDPLFDFYTKEGICKYIHKIVIPIYDINGDLVGTTAYDPIQTLITKDIAMLENKRDNEGLSVQEEKTYEGLLERKALKYILPSKFRMKLTNYFYAPKDTWNKIFKDGYAVIVDGMFDCIQLNHNGINCLALMGSEVSSQRMFMLNLIPNLFVFYDNDSSGLRVYKKIASCHNFVVPIKNRKTDDADDYIKQYGVGDLREEIDKRISWRIKSPIIMKG